jgi:hypothetical protein
VKSIKIVGVAHFEEANGLPGAAGDFDLDFLGSLPQASVNTIVLAGTLTVQTPLPAKLVGVRVRDGGPVTLTLAGQSFVVSDRFLAMSEDAPYSSVSISGTATVDLLVGG